MNKNKKIYKYKLVNIHKLMIMFFIMIGQSAFSQEVWTLNQCLDSAQVHNKNLQINRNQMILSEERLKEAQAQLYPKLMLNADYKYFMDLPHQLMPLNTFNPLVPEGKFKDVQFGVPHNLGAQVQFTMPIYHVQLYGAVQSTQIAKELSELQYQKTEEQVFFDITTLYYHVQLLQYQLSFLDSNLSNVHRLEKNMQLLKEQRLAKGTDIDKVKLQAEQLSIQKTNVYQKYLQALYALKLNIGIPLEKDIIVILDIQTDMTNSENSKIILDAQILQTQKRLLSHELRVLNQSRYLPSMQFIASYGTTGFGYSKKENAFLHFYPVSFAGIQLSYPLFNGTTIQRKINQKKIEIQNNELQNQLVTEKNEMEIGHWKRQKIATQNAVIHTKNQITLAQSIYDQTLIQHKQGMSTLSDILLADNALREAQQNYLNTIIDLLQADLELKKRTQPLRFISK